MNIKPMLAAKFDANKIMFPCLGSPKIDGIRSAIHEGNSRSRSMKLLPNIHLQREFGRKELNGLDGEFVIGSPMDPNCFRKTVSVVMSKDKPIDDLSLFIFDYIYGKDTFKERFLHLLSVKHDRIHVIEQVPIGNMEELLTYEQQCLSLGYEGIMLRDPLATYKYGRSTVKEGKLLKVKRFLDSEAIIVGMEELLHNNNEAKINELGLSSRATLKENKSKADTMGALVVEDINTGVRFNIGTGFTAKERYDIWTSDSIGKMVKYKYLPIGGKDKPRHPVFLGFRDRIDM